MSFEQDMAKVALQEKRLQFKQFNPETAWTIGSALKAAAEKRHVAVAIDIQLNGHTLFSFSMPGTTPDNWDWIRRKRNVVLRFRRSSYALRLKDELAESTSGKKMDLDELEYAPHGGCFPLLLAGTGCVGTITVSGLPGREDHGLIVSVLQDYLQVQGENLALDAESAA
jgi:uncharacterized protein (UPF0303 family)